MALTSWGRSVTSAGPGSPARRPVAVGDQHLPQPRPQRAARPRARRGSGRAGRCSASAAQNSSSSATDVRVSGSTAELTSSTAAWSDISLSSAKTTLTSYTASVASYVMTTMTHDTRRAVLRARSAPAWGSQSSPRCSSACPAPWPRGCSTRGWSAAAAVTARIVVAATGAARARAASRCAAGGTCCAPTPGCRRSTASSAVAGAQLGYFSRRLHAGRRRAADRVHRAGAVIGWLWLRHGQRPGRLTAGRRRARRRRSGAGARPGLRGRPRPGRRDVGAARDGRRRDLLRDVGGGGQRSAAGRARRRRARGRRGGAAARRCRRRARSDASTADPRRTTARPCRGGCPCWRSACSPAPSPTSSASWRRGLGLAGGVVRGARSRSLFALVFAWVRSTSCRSPIQFVGGAAVLAGVVLVKLGERRVATAASVEPLPATSASVSGRPGGG